MDNRLDKIHNEMIKRLNDRWEVFKQCQEVGEYTSEQRSEFLALAEDLNKLTAVAANLEQTRAWFNINGQISLAAQSIGRSADKIGYSVKDAIDRWINAWNGYDGIHGRIKAVISTTNDFMTNAKEWLARKT